MLVATKMWKSHNWCKYIKRTTGQIYNQQITQQPVVPFRFAPTKYCHSLGWNLPSYLINAEVVLQRLQCCTLHWSIWKTPKKRMRNFAHLHSLLLFALPPPLTRSRTIDLSAIKSQERFVGSEPTCNLILNAMGPFNHTSWYCRIQELSLVALFLSPNRVLRLLTIPLILERFTWSEPQKLKSPAHSYSFCHSWCESWGHNCCRNWSIAAQGRSSLQQEFIGHGQSKIHVFDGANKTIHSLKSTQHDSLQNYVTIQIALLMHATGRRYNT